jgi:hypothetical protein
MLTAKVRVSFAALTLASAGSLACAHDGTDASVSDASSSDPGSFDDAAPGLSARAAQAATSAHAGAVPMPKESAGGFLLRRRFDVTAEHPTLTLARKLLGPDRALAHVLDETDTGLSLEPAGFVTEAWRKPSAARQDAIGSVLPHRAGDHWRVSPSRIEKWALSLEPIGFADVAGRVDAGRVIYPDALPHTDMVAVGRDREVEQLFVLKDKDAPTELHWKLHLGSDLRARVLSTGAIDFLDGKGEPALRIQPPFAIDGAGSRVEASMTLAGDDLAIKIDARSLTYPVVLDPVLEVPIWVNVTPTSPTIPAAAGVQLAYSGDLASTVLLGGTTDSSGVIFGTNFAGYVGSVYKWNGVAWSTMAGVSSTLAQRYAPSMSAYGTGVLVFGGEHAGTMLRDTWKLSGSTWTQVCSTCLPPAQDWGQMAYLAGTGTVMFSSLDATAAAYKYTGGADWTKVAYGAADTGNGMVPPLRSRACMSADPVINKVLMVGGWNGSYTPFADAWQFDPTAGGVLFGDFHWTPVCGMGALTGCSFAPRASCGFAYDSKRKVHVLFGGETNASFPVGVYGYQDTWEYDSAANTWTQLCTTCAPMRWMAPLAFDPVRGRIVTASSLNYSSGSILNETWELHVRGGSCTADADCDTGHCVTEQVVQPGGGTLAVKTCCETTNCGACNTCSSAGSPGTCVPSPVNQPSYSVNACPSSGQCDGAGACKSPPGTACAAGSTCASGNCVDSVCCLSSACSVNYTCAPSGTCKKVLGQACLTPGECATGNCVDGVCCGSAACGAAQHCNYPAGLGTCLSDNAQSCASAAQCGSGNCVDRVCCSSACGSQCQACDVPGSVGTCIPVSGAVHPNSTGVARTACGGAGTCGSVCDGIDVSACHYPGSATSCGSASCASGSATAVGACSGGTCLQPATSCGYYACSGTVCKTSCAADTDCVSSGYYCNAGSCVAKVALGGTCSKASACISGACVDGVCCGSTSCAASQHCNYAASLGTCLADNGQACTAASQCGSGNCVDGVCCNSACGGQCQACDVLGSKGTCIPVSGSVHSSGTGPVRAACAGSGTCGSVCDGIDVSGCHYPGSSTSCGAASCAAGSATAVGSCSAGSCVQPSTSCGAYACSGTVCKTSCAVDADCANTTTYYCNAGTCTSKLALGATCSKASACNSGNCASGVCCDAACGSAGYSCSLAGSVGHCAKPNGTTCAAATECASGNCVDGVCCNSACTGQCQACDVGGNVGTCVATLGSAHLGGGLRSACSGSGTCGSSCDGVHVTACTFPTSSTACGAASCASGVQTNVGACNGLGSCAQATVPCGNYACGSGGACKTSCTVDGDCGSSAFYCAPGGTCQPRAGSGSLCSNDLACQSGHCVAGTCCDTACTATGFSCNLPTAPGHCTKATGTACASSAECGSGNCVDGVCCDTACAGQCQACDVSGSTGKCTTVIGTPHGTRSACGGSGAGTTCGATCDGKNAATCTYPTASTGCGAATCADGALISSYTQIGACNGSGSCTAGSGDCGTFKCAGTACGAACSATSQCSAGNYCDLSHGICVPIVGLGNSCSDPSACPSGYCVDGVCCEAACGSGYSCNANATTKGHCRKLQGVSCAVNAECASANCVDGYCCSSSCTGSCEACNVSGKEGTCTPIVGQPKTGHPACSATTTDPTCGLSCNGTDNVACHNATTATSCGNASCTGGIENDVSTCNGAGACAAATRPCAAYACGPTACLSTCAADGDCARGFFCKGGSCVGALPLGESCSGDVACQSGHCANGATTKVCCAVADCGAGAACASTGANVGTCLKNNASTCSASIECASGHCVDGVCCDLACDGQCEACDVKGSEGTCTPATGTPHGVRPVCDMLDASDCAKTKCDGSTRTACGGWVNVATTSCGADACTTDKRLQQRGHCDGKGSCQLPAPLSCGEFLCDTGSNACKTTCTADTDCADTYRCDSATSKCVQGSTCSADRTQAIDKTGLATSCAPYMCGTNGECLRQCATSDDCVSGSSCDPAVHACVTVVTQYQDTGSGSGGCDVGSGTPGSRGAFAVGALGLAAAMVARRRRRAA